jgi:UDP-glucose 4-epimerase
MNEPLFGGRPVLVTGGYGFIGSHLVETLIDRGAHVTVLDNLQAGKQSNLGAVSSRVRVMYGDIRDRRVVTRIAYEVAPVVIFHLAANASVPGSVEEPLYDFETNCAGTFILLNALRRAGACEKIVVVSSGAVYGEPCRFPIRESDPLRPISPYGSSKLGAEIATRMFHSVYGLPVVIARLFNTYGPRMARFVMLDFLRKLQRNPRVLELLGTGRQVRDFNYVSDTVEGLLLLGERGEPGEAYNVSSGVSTSIIDLAHTMIAALGLANTTVIRCTGTSWVGDAQHWEVSIRKIADLGYQPSIPLAEGLKRVIAWFCEENAFDLPDPALANPPLADPDPEPARAGRE